MAENQNKKVTSTNQNGAKQSQKSRSAKAKTKKPPIASHRKVVITFLLALLGVVIIFLIWGAFFVYDMIKEPKPLPIDFPLVSFTGTPDDEREKVEYYLLGIFGEDVNKNTMETLSYVAVDKVARKINVLQLPQDTYAGTDPRWSASRVSDVWANPTPLVWCETERKNIDPKEVDTEENKHVGCGGVVTRMPGSSAGDLCTLFNLQYGLPVDGYVLFPQESLVKLVNQIGGIDVNLEDKMTVGEVTYPKGVQTLDGDAALSYAKRRSNDSIKADSERLVRVRKVYLALFDRLEAQGIDMMKKNSIGPVMNGSTPLRIYMPKTKAEQNESHRDILMKKIYEYRDITPENIRAFVLPGTAKKIDKTTFYSPNKGQLLELLNAHFRPHLSPLDEGTLALLPDFAGGTTAEMYEQAFSEFAVVQSNLQTESTTAG